MRRILNLSPFNLQPILDKAVVIGNDAALFFAHALYIPPHPRIKHGAGSALSPTDWGRGFERGDETNTLETVRNGDLEK